MRKCIQKWERKRAMAVLARVSNSLNKISGEEADTDEYKVAHGFLGEGSFNAVYALSADLVLRVEKAPGWDPAGWKAFTLAQMFPHENLPVIWEIGVCDDGRRWAIVERLGIQYAALPGVDGYQLVPPGLTSAAVAHLEQHDVYLSDNHGFNLMRRRKSDVWVISDPM